jgi:methionyl-tRNA formyltransferase
MDQGFDTGPIVLQEQIPVPAEVRLPAFERVLAERGARLLVRAVTGLSRGEIEPVPQDNNLATTKTAPIPTDDDFLLPTDRDAAWAYRFARAVAPLEGPLAVHDLDSGKRIPVRDAIDWTPVRGKLGPRSRDSASIVVPFRTGSVRFLLPREESDDG